VLLLMLKLLLLTKLTRDSKASSRCNVLDSSPCACGHAVAS
jgi:hypothetical protein